MLVSLLLILAMAAPQASQGTTGSKGTTPARGATTGRVTFAIAVTDPAGAPLPDVKVTMTGATERASRTEGGRIVFENLPAGNYRFRFDKEGFVPFERELTARGTAPIDVKVTLTPAPAPPARPPAPIAPPPAAAPPRVDAKLVVLDMPAFIEKYYVKRAAGTMTPLACSTGGASTLIQINDPIATHVHEDADEFVYVIAGQGSANMGERHEALGPGVYMMIPRGTAHGFTTGAKKPLVMISTRAGERCAS
jgi:mannose-6-phosphate isomerase-like protein (cupin superfamily)